MLFNSSAFIIFFFVVGILYFTIPHRFQWVLLLAASYYFYMSWRFEYAILLIILTLLNYYAGILVGKNWAKAKQTTILILSLLLNIGVLLWFKYVSFFISSFGWVIARYNLNYHPPVLNILLPLGISFYLFKIMNYTIDVYRGHKTPERHLGIFSLYVAFFPQLIAGPIDRATKLLSQFHERHDFDYHRVTDGLKLMLWGFFQKVVIADTLATLVDPIYNDPVHYQGIHFAIATVFFAFQIYCDFSGYSDIAIGAAQVFGYTSINNFERPYFSKSIPEFWRRWHISLSTWFRDYLYVPLGGNRVSLSRLYFNILIVFLVSGLWHGSNWTFVVWGGVHGFYYIMSVITQSARTKLIRIIGLHKTPIVHKYLKAAITFFLVSFAWIFFRANSISDALFIVSHIFTGWEQGFGALSPFTQSKFEFIIGVASTLFMVFGHLLQRRGSVREMLSQKPLVVRWALYYGIILLILLLGNFGSKQFIYFQF